VPEAFMPGNRGKTMNQAAEAPDDMGYFHWFEGRPSKSRKNRLVICWNSAYSGSSSSALTKYRI
jgi:hypothetical protein